MSTIVREFHQGKIQEVRLVAGRCPNVGQACNCTGACSPVTVPLDDPRTDEQILADTPRACSTSFAEALRGEAAALAKVRDEAHQLRAELKHANDETDPLWSELFDEVRHAITYKPGYRILLKPDAELTDHGRWYYQVECDRVDAITGERGVGRGGKAYLSPHATRSELVQTVFGLLKSYEEHECREFFRYDGQQVFGPHFDVLALHEIAAANRTEYRP